MDIGVDKVLFVMRVDCHQCALVFCATGCLGALIILQLVHILQTLPGAVSGPAVRTRVLVLHCDCGGAEKNPEVVDAKLVLVVVNWNACLDGATGGSGSRA